MRSGRHTYTRTARRPRTRRCCTTGAPTATTRLGPCTSGGCGEVPPTGEPVCARADRRLRRGVPGTLTDNAQARVHHPSG
jgi:hypothetical protein